MHSSPGFFNSDLTKAFFHVIRKVPFESDLFMMFPISGTRVSAGDLRREPRIASSSHDFPLDLHIRLWTSSSVSGVKSVRLSIGWECGCGLYGRIWSSPFLILVIFSRKNDANLTGKLSSAGRGFSCLVPVGLYTRLKIYLALPLKDLIRSLTDSLSADCSSLM